MQLQQHLHLDVQLSVFKNLKEEQSLDYLLVWTDLHQLPPNRLPQLLIQPRPLLELLIVYFHQLEQSQEHRNDKNGHLAEAEEIYLTTHPHLSQSRLLFFRIMIKLMN